MIINLIKSSIRFFLKNKVSTLINLIGLSVGLASCILIYIFISNELSFDNYHSKGSRIYRIVKHTYKDDGISYNAETEFPVSETIRMNFPDIGIVTRIFYSQQRIIRIGEKRQLENDILFAESEIFKIFDFKWIVGNPKYALKEKNSVVLTEGLVKKYFKDKDAIDKILTIERGVNVKVTGIVKDPPTNTHLPYSMIASIESLNSDFVGINYDRSNIILSGFCAYILLPENLDSKYVEDQFDSFIDRNLTDESKRGKYYYRLQSLKKIHYATEYSTFNYTISKKVILIFVLVGIFILFIACVNFVNLAIAQTLKRSKDVGIRKIIGAHRSQLIKQYIGEAYFMTFVAIIFAVILAEIFLPSLNLYLGHESHLSLYSNSAVIPFLLIIFLTMGLFTGFYPAVILSGFKPLNAIKSKISTHKKSVTYFKNSLIVVQFVISQVLIIGTIIIYLQLNYVKNKDLGFDSNAIIKLNIPDQSKVDVFKNDLLTNANILNLTQCISSPLAGDDERFTSEFYTPEMGKENALSCDTKAVDNNYLKTFKLNLVAGEWHILRRPTDSIRNVVVNEALVRKLGLESNIDAIGVKINFGRISGVVKDFHLESLHNDIMPVIFLYFPDFFGSCFMKVNDQNIQESIQYIEKTWMEIFPGEFLNYEVLDEYIQGLYRKEKQIFQIISFFSVIAILLACLGLFGLISFMVVQRTPEIGIRKVLGAHARHIIKRMSKEYLLLIIVSNLIAWPLSWYYLENWLNQFVYRINFPWWVMLLAMAISGVLALLTTGYHVLKAVNTNPVESIRYE